MDAGKARRSWQGEKKLAKAVSVSSIHGSGMFCLIECDSRVFKISDTVVIQPHMEVLQEPKRLGVLVIVKERTPSWPLH